MIANAAEIGPQAEKSEEERLEEITEAMDPGDKNSLLKNDSLGENISISVIVPEDKDFIESTEYFVKANTTDMEHVNCGDNEMYAGSGISYDEKSNTLILDGFDHPDYLVSCSYVGPAFSIKATGDNTFDTLYINGSDSHGASDEMCSTVIYGDGSLTLQGAMVVTGDAGETYLTIEDDLSLDVKGKTVRADRGPVVVELTSRDMTPVKEEYYKNCLTLKGKTARISFKKQDNNSYVSMLTYIDQLCYKNSSLVPTGKPVGLSEN